MSVGGRKSAFGAGAIAALCLSTLLAAGPLDLPGTGDTPVADAAQAGDRETVRSLLRQGADVNAAQGDGMTALHWAAMMGDRQMAEMLLHAGANLRAATRLGAFTPLLLAAKNGQAAIVAALLDKGADANAATSTGTAPLMLAAASGSVEAVRLLLDHGADVNAAESAMGETALMFAAAYGRAPVIDLLVERGAEIGVATQVVDVAALDKEDQAARKRKNERLKEEAARAAAAERERNAEGAAPAPGGQASTSASRKDEDGRGGGGGRSFLGKLFSWIGSGGKGSKDNPERPRPPSYAELVGTEGGLTPLLFAARHGHRDAVEALVEAGADVNQVSEGDGTSPLLIATINGHFDLGMLLLELGADPNRASDAGATPLYAALNVQWAPKALYPQPRAYTQQRTTHLDFMKALLDKGADPNARLKKKIWYSSYNFDLSGVDETGATPFWRAAYALDVEAMRLLVAHGADPNIPTIRVPERRFDQSREEEKDHSGLPPVPIGGPAVMPIHAATGVGYGKEFAANSHRHVPEGWLPAVKYLVEELGADVNARDHEGYTPLHNAAARGDNELILYLVSKGADVTAVSRKGQTTADMANGPVQRVEPYPETIALLMKLGSKNNNKCVSC